jgi:hypothetical protein
MSVDAMSWTFKHSPYTLGSRLVHLALADIANDDHEYMLWVSQSKIATKAKVSVPTVSAALKRMVQDGYLRLVSREAGGPTVYQFLKPFPGTPQESEPPKNPNPNPPSSSTEPPKSTQTRLLPTEDKPKEENTTAAERLCGVLADRIDAYRGGGARPAITGAWRTDMRLLLERGPLGRAKAEAHDPIRVQRAMDRIFSELADADNGGFCWAAQIRSPGALRRHWDQAADTLRRRGSAGPQRDPLRGRHDESIEDRMGVAMGWTE